MLFSSFPPDVSVWQRDNADVASGLVVIVMALVNKLQEVHLTGLAAWRHRYGRQVEGFLNRCEAILAPGK